MSIGNFNIHGLMSASTQLEKLAQIMRDGREGAQIQFAAEVEKHVDAAKSRVAPPSASERGHVVDEDRGGGQQDVYEGATSRERRKETDKDDHAETGDIDIEAHHIDIIA